MSLKFAILGILNARPMSGYDLKHQVFDATVQHFWPADQSQIYRTLNQLLKAGQVSVSIEEQNERPDRKVYTITESGSDALKKWLLTNQATPIFRDPLLVQLFFGQEIFQADLLEIIEKQKQAHRIKLKTLQQIPIPPPESNPHDRWLALQHLTLEFGLALEEMYVAWLAHCREVIASVPDADEVEDFRNRFAP